jgi:hypothetical protein
MMIRKVLLVVYLVCIAFVIKAQYQNSEISLQYAIDRAQSFSLNAFKQKNMYLAKHWGYQSYLADHLPSLHLSMHPFNYRRSFTSRYNSQTNLDEYREQQNLTSSASLSLQQKLFPTGGTVFVKSDLSRLENLRTSKNKSFSATPISIGIDQPLFAFNSFKWESKIEPLKFKIAKKQYISNMQEVNIRTVQLFFDLALSQLNNKMARLNSENTKNLYKLGKERFRITSISESDLLNLELNVLNAEIKQSQEEKNEKQAAFELALFLGLETKTKLNVQIPDIVKSLEIDTSEALDLALKNSPQILNFRREEYEADRELDRTKKENRFQMDLKLSYGLNQEAKTFQHSYKNPLSQQIVSLGVEVPILDWGKRKGRYKMALKNREVTELEIKERQIDFEQEVNRLIVDFNLQGKLIESARRAKDIALKTYKISLEKFKTGNMSVIELDDALKKQDSAQQNYINNLKNYWVYYYKIQKFTQHNFIRQQSIEEDFNKMI